MTWIQGMKLIAAAAESLAFLVKEVNRAREENRPVDLAKFRARDDAVSKAVAAEIEKQRAESGTG